MVSKTSPIKTIAAAVLATMVGVLAEPVVSNLHASQVAGTKWVELRFDISGGAPPYSVTIQGSADGGVTWTLPLTTVSGHVGAGVSPGLARTIAWNAGQDWDGQFSQMVRFRLSASDSESLNTPDGFSTIPAGTFQMGRSTYNRTAPWHTVNVSEFRMGQYEVTKELWDHVRAWGAGNGYPDLAAGNGTSASKGANHPVHSVTWYDVVKWCNARSEKEGLVPCYYTDAEQTAVYRTGAVGIDNTMVKWTSNGYRLPTEAEWEKAARGGLYDKNFPWGDFVTHDLANYYSSSSDFYDRSSTRGYHPTYKVGEVPYSAPVGSFPQSGFDLYDMAGNVCEWCWDHYGSYDTSLPTDPKGSLTGNLRVFRGGSWSSFSFYMNCYSRDNLGLPDFYLPYQTYNSLGFRLARSVNP